MLESKFVTFWINDLRQVVELPSAHSFTSAKSGTIMLSGAKSHKEREHHTAENGFLQKDNSSQYELETGSQFIQVSQGLSYPRE